MKRGIIAAALLLVAAAVSIAGYYITKNEINKINKMLEDVMYNTDENKEDLIYEKTEEIVKKWRKAEKILTILLKHNTTTQVDQSMRLLQNCAKNKDSEELFKVCYEAHAQLSSILESEVPSINNIF